MMWRLTTAGKSAEEESSESKRQRTAGPGYTAKNTGFPLRQGALPGQQTDQQGLPLDPQQVVHELAS